MSNKTVFPTTPPKPTSRRTLWIVAAVVVVIVVIATVLVIGLNHSGTTTNRPVATTPTTSAPPTSASSGGSGFTGTTVDKFNKPVQLPANPAGQLLPQTAKTPQGQNDAPGGLTWEKLYDLPIVPFSTSDGPTTIKDGIAQGWSRTPQGAALAGVSILSMWLGGPDTESATVQRTLLSGDPTVIAQRTAQNRPARQSMLADPQLAPGAVAGVQVRSFNGNFATVDYGSGPVTDDSDPSGYYIVQTLSLSWSDGTWKLIVTPTTPDRGQHQTAIAGMTSWTE